MTRTDWLPGVVVVVLGLVAALVLLVARRRPAPPPKSARRQVAPAAGEEAELRYARLLDQLRELEADRYQRSPEAHAAERARLERLAADALRARDAARETPEQRPAPAAPHAPTGFFARHPQLQGAFWGATLVVFFGAIGLWVTRDARPRGEGDVATGTAGRGEAPPPQAEDAAFASALAQVKDNPGDVETSAHVVHELIRRQDYDEARQLTERSLGVDPFLTEARVHRAFLRAASGDEPGAVADLQRLATVYPRSHEALLFLGMIRMRAGDNRAALEAFERFLAEAPEDEQPPQMRAAISALRQQLGATPP